MDRANQKFIFKWRIINGRNTQMFLEAISLLFFPASLKHKAE
jgi:hypothetical protein